MDSRKLIFRKCSQNKKANAQSAKPHLTIQQPNAYPSLMWIMTINEDLFAVFCA